MELRFPFTLNYINSCCISASPFNINHGHLTAIVCTDNVTTVLSSSACVRMGLLEQSISNLELCEGETLANGLSMTHGLFGAKQNKQKLGRKRSV